MSFDKVRKGLAEDLKEIKEAGLWKTERNINSNQTNHISLEDGQQVTNMCANNYLGLANDQRIIQAAKDSYDHWGYGLASVRFICGTQTIHKMLEKKVSEFL
jgi:glycine C-acetyltransferase